MKSVDSVGVTFVNTVLGRGVLNGVVNLSFGVLQFTPSETDSKVDPDLVVASRLRMDKNCAKQLYETLGDLLVLIDKAEADLASGLPAAEDATVRKPN